MVRAIVGANSVPGLLKRRRDTALQPYHIQKKEDIHEKKKE